MRPRLLGRNNPIAFPSPLASSPVERYFRTVRDQFLTRQLDLSSLESLNRQFTQWVEEQYNAQVHSVLGMSSLDRFALDRNAIDFHVQVLGLSFHDAMRQITGA